MVKQLAGEKSKKVLSKSADLPISMDVGRVHNSPGALRVTRTVRRSSEMSGLILLAVMLVLATTATALVTGKVLAVKKNDVFQLEMVREAMRRKLHDLELRTQTVQGNLDLVAKIKQEKVEAVRRLSAELTVLETESPIQIGVNQALVRKSFDLTEAAAA